MLTEVHHHRRIKWCRVLEGFDANQELQIWILLDLLNQVFIREPEPRLDDQGSQCHAKGLCQCSKFLAEFCRVVVLQLIPRNELSQLDPAIVTRNCRQTAGGNLRTRADDEALVGTCGKLRAGFGLKPAHSFTFYRQKLLTPIALQ